MSVPITCQRQGLRSMLSLFWRGQDYLIADMKVLQIGGSALATGVLLHSFVFS